MVCLPSLSSGGLSWAHSPSRPLKDMKIPYFSPRGWQQEGCGDHHTHAHTHTQGMGPGGERP